MVTQRALVATTVALLAALTLPVTLSVAPARAQTIIDEWDR